MMQITKVIPMDPFGKARPRVVKRGRKVHTFMPEDYEGNRASLRMLFGPVDVAGPCRLDVIAYRPIPKSWSKKKKREAAGTYTTTTPDIDNIIGAVMDSLFEDDSIVVECGGAKKWSDDGEGRMEITITQL